VPNSAGNTIKKNGGVSIFVHHSVKFSNIHLEGNSTELDIELCAIKLNLLSVNVIIISIYRLPTGNFKHYLNKLENILNSLHRNKTEIIICGDINVTYLVTSHGRQQLDMVLSTYNLINSV
jgi:exonuclease III